MQGDCEQEEVKNKLMKKNGSIWDNENIFKS